MHSTVLWDRGSMNDDWMKQEIYPILMWSVEFGAATKTTETRKSLIRECPYQKWADRLADLETLE
jgi:hypothetical protein